MAVSKETQKMCDKIAVYTCYHQGAWGEIQTRLSMRQTSQVAFATSVVALAAGSITVLGQDLSKLAAEIIFYVLAAGGALLSWVFVAWVRHNELIIKDLCGFNASLESQLKVFAGEELEGWFSGNGLQRSLAHRRLTDYAMIALHLATTVPSVVVIFSIAYEFYLLDYHLSFFGDTDFRRAIAHVAIALIAAYPAKISHGTYMVRQPKKSEANPIEQEAFVTTTVTAPDNESKKGADNGG